MNVPDDIVDIQDWANWKTYKWKGEPLFTVYTQRSIEDLSESHNATYVVLKCQQFAEFYPGKKINP